MNQWVIGAFYTEDTAYEDVIKEYLLPSTERLGIQTIIKSIPSKGNWQTNVAEKPKIILDILEELSPEQCLVFVDADAVFMKYPMIFDQIPQEYDLACHYLNWNQHYGYKHPNPINELLSGTLFLRNRMCIKELCKKWYNFATKSNQWEQKCLEKCLAEDKFTRVYKLPYEYVSIATLPDGRPHPKVVDGIVVHHQVSRKYKRGLK